MNYNLENIRNEFPALKNIIYFDNASTSQKPQCVIDIISNYLKKTSNIGRGIYKLSQDTTEKCCVSRDIIGLFFNIDSNNIIFTKNTTDSINIVVNGLKLKKRDHIIITSIEHNSNFIPWIMLKNKGIDITIVDEDKNGFISLYNIKKNINKYTKLVSITHISNFYGSKQDIDSIIKLCHDLNILVLIDGAQSAGHIPIDLKKIDCDIFVTSGHKGLLGPQGIGILYIKDPNVIKPTNYGGGSVNNIYIEKNNLKIDLKPFPYNFEVGTPNVLGIIGIGESVKYISHIGISNIEKYESSITNYCLNKLKKISNIEIYGNLKKTNLISFNIKDIDCNTLAIYLDDYNILVRSGYHCANYIHNKLKIDGSVRVSFGLYNTKKEINYMLDVFSEMF